MKYKMNFRQAYSLIEISIMMLIIGILITGVTESSVLIRKFKLSNAKALTQSSPVIGIMDLSLWLETTSEKSFPEEEPDDGSLVTRWNDLNTQRVINNTVFQYTDASKPVYTERSMNALPALKFSGGQTLTANIRGENLFQADQLTIFIVQYVTSNGSATASTFLWNDDNPVNVSATQSGSIYFDCGDVTTNRIAYPVNSDFYSTSKVLSFIFKSTEYGDIKVNSGTPVVTSSTLTSKIAISNSKDLIIGSDLTGYIGEIIVYSRALKDSERNAVEEYLLQKWVVVGSTRG